MTELHPSTPTHGSTRTMRRCGGFAVGPNTGSPARYTSLLVAITICAFGAFYLAAIRPNLVPKRFASVVEGRIYRAGALTPAAMEMVVRERGIRTLVDLGAFARDSVADQRVQRTADALDIQRFRFNVGQDVAGDPDEYARALEVMADRAFQPVLVLCNTGTEQTGCAVAMYRHIYESVPLTEALDEAIAMGYSMSSDSHLVRTLLDKVPAVAHAVRTNANPDAEPQSIDGERH